MNLNQTENVVFAWMFWADQHGVWGIISTFSLLASLAGIFMLLWGKARVRNLNFFIRQSRDDTDYPLKIHVEIRNYTGRSVVISMPYFIYQDLRRDPNARGDSLSGEYEIKFPDPSNENLAEVEYLLRHRESVLTFVPVDPAHTDDEIAHAINKKMVGKLSCMCIWLQDKPKVHKLSRRI
jgi:hypothetical protein